MATTRIDPIKKTFTITASPEEYSALILALVTAAGVLDFKQTAVLNSVMGDSHITKAGMSAVKKLRKQFTGDILLLTACDLLMGKPKAIDEAPEPEPEPEKPATEVVKSEISSTETKTEPEAPAE